MPLVIPRHQVTVLADHRRQRVKEANEVNHEPLNDDFALCCVLRLRVLGCWSRGGTRSVDCRTGTGMAARDAVAGWCELFTRDGHQPARDVAGRILRSST